MPNLNRRGVVRRSDTEPDDGDFGNCCSEPRRDVLRSSGMKLCDSESERRFVTTTLPVDGAESRDDATTFGVRALCASSS